MKVTQKQLKRIIREEYQRFLLLEEPQDGTTKEDMVKSAELAASKYGLAGLDWNSIVTTIVASGTTGAMSATGVLAPVAQVINGAALVKAGYEAVQSARSSVQLEKLIKEYTGEYPNVALMGFTWDRPLTREAVEVIKNLPQDKKDRLGLLLARTAQYAKRAIVSMINASPDEVLSGGVAGTISLMPLEEFVIASSQLAVEVIDMLPWVDDFLRMDNFVSKAYHTILNRTLLLNVGRIAGALDMLDPARLDRLPDAPEMEIDLPELPGPAGEGESAEDIPLVDDDEEEEEEEVVVHTPGAWGQSGGIQPIAEGLSYDRLQVLCGLDK